MFILSIQGCVNGSYSYISNTCAPPCWAGITPGITPKDELIEVLKSNLAKKIKTIEDDKDGWKIFDYILQIKLVTGDEIIIYCIDNFVTEIDITNRGRISSISNMINLFGEPKYVARSTILGPGSLLFVPSSAYHEWFFVIYPEKGVVFGLDTYYEGKDINPNTKITSLQYFDPKKFDLLLGKGFLVFSTEGYSEEQFIIWKGYGDIDVLYPK